MYTECRKAAKETQESACFKLHIGLRTLQNYEKGAVLPPPEVVAKMAEVYHEPGLPITYCTRHCPIGCRYHYQPEARSLESSVIGLIKEIRHVNDTMPQLIDIADDGVVSSDEVQALAAVMDELADLERSIVTMRYRVADKINIVKLVQAHRGIKKAPGYAAKG